MSEDTSPLFFDELGGAVSYPTPRELHTRNVPRQVRERFDAAAEEVGGPWEQPSAYEGSVGRTMFDTPASADTTVTVLIPRENMHALPSQSLVRIHSLPDGREYLGAVVRGPFAEPDGMRGDAPIVVTTTVKGAVFIPQFHGRVEVELMGERVDGVLVPHRFRPLPNSPVFALDPQETAQVLRVSGDIPLGLAVGHEELRVSIPAGTKSVLPRHLAVLGTTGGGKSTTVSGLVANFQLQGLATILIDTEGEYAEIGAPTDDPQMVGALRRRKLEPRGVGGITRYQLHNPRRGAGHDGRTVSFSLDFSGLSPYMVAEILELNETQQVRWFKAFDITKHLLRVLKLIPEGTQALEDPDEMVTGFPGMKLAHMVDVIAACTAMVSREDMDFAFRSPDFQKHSDRVWQELKGVKGLDFPSSWRAVAGRVNRLYRTGLFDNAGARVLNFRAMIQPGRVSIIDLSDTDSPQLNNLVIAELLRGVAAEQNRAYQQAEGTGKQPPRTMIVIEEAHEFLSAERIKQMPALFQQVARISRRGRKRWLGLVFVTQLPQHLPDEVLGLVNNYVLHKITDATVISKLKRSIGGIDESLWDRLPGLAPGQAIVSTTNMSRPLLVAIDPTPCKLRMTE